jgi:hypothetical protein
VTLEHLHVAPLALSKGDVDRQIRFSCRVYYPPGLGAVARERFLAEHVPAPFEGGYGDGGVQVVRRPDAHDVEVVAGNEFLPARVQFGHIVELAEFAQAVLLQSGERDGLDTRHPHEVLEVLLARVA